MAVVFSLGSATTSKSVALRTSSVTMNCWPRATGTMLPPRTCSGTLSVMPACAILKSSDQTLPITIVWHLLCREASS